MKQQYEAPTLNEGGDICEVVLGLISFGYDLDGTAVIGDFEFEDDLRPS